MRMLNGFVYAATIAVLFAGECGAPSARHIVALDIGHTRQSGGSRSAHGVMEFFFNKKIIEEVAERLRGSADVQPVVINPDGDPISLSARAAAASEAKAELLVSIHHDAAHSKYISEWEVNGRKERYSDKFSGFSIFYSPKNTAKAQSASFARLLGEAMIEAGNKPTLHHAEKIRGEGRELIDAEIGLYEYPDLIVLKAATMPAVLLECGVIVNRIEEEILSSAEGRGQVVRAIVSAIRRYFEHSDRLNQPPDDR